jgi:hypothetical protein
MTFRPDGRMLITEKAGTLYLVTADGKQRTSVSGAGGGGGGACAARLPATADKTAKATGARMRREVMSMDSTFSNDDAIASVSWAVATSTPMRWMPRSPLTGASRRSGTPRSTAADRTAP